MSMKAKGNYINQAGRDLIMQESLKINFYEEDLVNIINIFKDVFDEKIDEKTEVYMINIEDKNEKNNLTEEYFKNINNEYLPHFNKIDNFLKDDNNKEYLSDYLSTCSNINTYLKANRNRVKYFEEFFPILIDSLLRKEKIKSAKNENLFNLFFHYMYWNCDIGDK